MVPALVSALALTAAAKDADRDQQEAATDENDCSGFASGHDFYIGSRGRSLYSGVAIWQILLGET
jgi:hypothetical protein